MKNLPAALLNTADQHGDNLAVVTDHGTLTWSAFVSRVARAATVLQEWGVECGQRFGILALNSAAQAEITYAGYWLGATPVPVNYRLAAVEIATIVRAAGCQLIISDEEVGPLLEAESLAEWRGRSFLLSGAALDYQSLIDKVDAAPAYGADCDDEALLLFTGGTAGQPKGVALTHRNILANAAQISSRWPARTSDVVLHVAPMFHSAELCMMPYTLAGAGHVYLPKFSPEALFEAIEKHRVTETLLVPTMIMMCVQANIACNYDLSSLTHILYGASPMTEKWLQQAVATFSQVHFAHGYGLTETSPLLCLLDAHDHRRALESEPELLGSCGRALPGVDLKIVDEEGAAVVPGELGEIIVRGENVFNGYLAQPQLTDQVLGDGWFHTGDVGEMDAAGYVFLRDRKKDMIISGGENVYSSEVEAVLSQHPDVFEAAVIGLPDERYGERVFAIIVPEPATSPTEQSIVEHCRGLIGGYKIPRGIAFVAEIPKSALGKPLKTVLRERYSH